MSCPGRLAQFGRLDVIPTVLPVLFQADGMRRFPHNAPRLAGDAACTYCSSPLSATAAVMPRWRSPRLGEAAALQKLMKVSHNYSHTPSTASDAGRSMSTGDVRLYWEACASAGASKLFLPWRPRGDAFAEAGFMCRERRLRWSKAPTAAWASSPSPTPRRSAPGALHSRQPGIPACARGRASVRWR